MFAKYSSEKFPLTVIYNVLKFKKKPEHDTEEVIGNSTKVFPIVKTDLGEFKSRNNIYDYIFFIKELKKKSKKDRPIILKKNKEACRLYSIQSVIGLCNDLTV